MTQNSKPKKDRAEDLETGLIKAMIENPDEFKASNSSLHVAAVSFDSPLRGIIAEKLFKAITEQSEPVLLDETLDELRNMEPIYSGISNELELIGNGNTVIPSDIIDQWETHCMLLEMQQGLIRAKTDPSKGLEHIRTVARVSGKVLEKFEASREIQVLTGKEISSECLGVVQTAFEEMQAGGRLEGLRAGISSMDRELGPVRPGQLVIFAARPGAGKSAILAQLMHQGAVRRNEPILSFNLELPIEEQAARLISQDSESGQSIENIANSLSRDPDAFVRLGRGVENISNANIFAVKNTRMTIDQIDQTVRSQITKNGIKWVFIDYLTLIYSQKGEKRDHQFYGLVAQRLKSMAKDYNVGVITAAQLNRESVKTNRAPKLEDLRESGGIEQAADKVVLMWMRPQEVNGVMTDYEIRPGVFWVRAKIGKNRQGKKGGLIDMQFDGHSGIFREHADEY